MDKTDVYVKTSGNAHNYVAVGRSGAGKTVFMSQILKNYSVNSVKEKKRGKK